jgi:glyoxylase-like metal-dependent hydrolase (beta-lactamase superfamily II)
MEYHRHEFPQPFYGSVNIYRIGDTLIDTGHVAATCAEQVREAIVNGPLSDVERVLLTHPHIDHVGGSQIIPELAALPHVVYEGVPEILHDFSGYLARVHGEIRTMGSGLEGDVDAVIETYFPGGEYTEEQIAVERAVGDGDTVELGDTACEVVHTPGHSKQHMALVPADGDSVLSADLLSQNGHFMFGPLYADIGAYKASLQRIRRLDAAELLPGHGPIVDDPDSQLADALAKAERATEAIRSAVKNADGEVPARRLAREVFGANDRTVGFLTFVVCAYFEHLAGQNELAVVQEDSGVYATQI